MKRLLIVCSVIICSATTAFACWQTESTPSVIGGQTLNLRVTDNGKPRKGLKFNLHEAITFDRHLAQWTGAFEKKILGSATTDSQGLLSFGEVKPGLYWIVGGDSLSWDSIAVDFSPAARVTSNRRIWIAYHDDGCLDVEIELVNQDASKIELNAQTH